MFDTLVDSMNPGVIRTLFKLFSPFIQLCTKVVEYMDLTLRSLLTQILESQGVPDWIVRFINKILSTDAAFIYNVTLGEMLLGGLLFIILCYGIVKFFTDIVL